jgi:3-dehydroquinate synthase
MTQERKVQVRAGEGKLDYPVLFGSGLRERIPALLREHVPSVERWAVISDTNVGLVHGAATAQILKAAELDGTLILTPAGEAKKTRRHWGALTDQLLDLGFGRDAGIVAVGGGVVGDLAGFVAATYMRGIPVVQVPTSLLAMIDASVGGKTGVDTQAGKNLVGAFHPPSLVVVDPQVVATLPRAERAHGLVEAIKHGAILDAEYGAAVSQASTRILTGDLSGLTDVVYRSVELKAQVVGQDERESGMREILNFGHTVAHALERVHSFGLPHGTAVAQGMLWEARLGEELGLTAPGTTLRIREWLAPLGLPLDPSPVEPEVFARALTLDKKARSAVPRVVLLSEVGNVARTEDGRWAHPVSPERILQVAPWSTG